MSEVKAISVTQLARRMRNVLEIQVGELWVEGEVSNLRQQASGHWYFTLKDERAQLACAMFGARRRPGAEVLEDGAQVKVFAEVTLYEARGQAQIIVQKAQAAGVGGLQAKFEALKAKLQAEGLFAAERKKDLPAFPKTIGLVTSPSGAALQDIMNVLQRRAPWLEVVLFPAQVQGKGAERGIARAIARAARAADEGLPVPELLIVGRGGGSLEDLWCFNEEIVARAIADCPLPVISAVGHEIDFTIADFVADVRAPTPSAAAELAVPDESELRERVERLRQRLQRAGAGRIERWQERMRYLRQGLVGQSGERVLRERILRLADQRSRLERSVAEEFRTRSRVLENWKQRWSQYHPEQVLQRHRERLAHLSGKLDWLLKSELERREERLRRSRALLGSLGPEKVLQRGYAIARNPAGQVISDPAQVTDGEALELVTHGGSIRTRVEKK
ncbi:MAG: exodeoxyribonuclease VII large subunit [Verrucomicrobiales bacterium]